jgi:hypothetical protein
MQRSGGRVCTAAAATCCAASKPCQAVRRVRARRGGCQRMARQHAPATGGRAGARAAQPHAAMRTVVAGRDCRLACSALRLTARSEGCNRASDLSATEHSLASALHATCLRTAVCATRWALTAAFPAQVARARSGQVSRGAALARARQGALRNTASVPHACTPCCAELTRGVWRGVAHRQADFTTLWAPVCARRKIAPNEFTTSLAAHVQARSAAVLRVHSCRLLVVRSLHVC